MKHRCNDFRALVGDASELGALSVDERAMFADHLDECADCLASLKGMVVQRSVLRSVFKDASAETPISDEFVRRCVTSMKRAARSESSGAGERSA